MLTAINVFAALAIVSWLPVPQAKSFEEVPMMASFSPDGTRVVVTSIDSVVRVWDAKTGAKTLELKADNFRGIRARFSPDGMRIVTDDRHGLRIWNARTGRELKSIRDCMLFGSDPTYFPDSIRVFVFSPWWKRTHTDFFSDSRISIMNSVTGKKLFEKVFPSPSLSSASLSPDGRFAGLVREDGKVMALDLESGLTLWKREGLQATSAGFSPDGKYAVVTSGETVQVLDAGSGRAIRTVGTHIRKTLWATFSPNGELVLTFNGLDLKVWEFKTGKEVQSWYKPKAELCSFSPDSATILCSMPLKAIELLDIRTGTLIRSFGRSLD